VRQEEGEYKLRNQISLPRCFNEISTKRNFSSYEKHSWRERSTLKIKTWKHENNKYKRSFHKTL